MRVKPKELKVVKPNSFFNIKFGCSNRDFYGVKSDLHIIAEAVGIEIQDGYITEKCDYEGDLEEIRIHAEERSSKFRVAVLEFYGIDIKVNEYHDIVLSIF